MLRAVVALALGWAFVSGCAVRHAATPPLYITPPRFGSDPGKALAAPVIAALSAKEEALLLAEAGQEPRMARYPYSGCHDRAHALYLKLAARWPGKLAKVWLFAPRSFSPVSHEGYIRPRDSMGLPPDSKPPEWDYHVALAYKGPGGQWRVLDPVVSAEKFRELEVAKWIGLFEVPPGTVWTVLSAEHYLFYRVDIAGRNEGAYFNGNFFDYVGPARDEGYIPAALARDRVGMLLLQKRDCASLAELRSKPFELLAELQKASTFGSPECQAYLKEFHDAHAFWTQKVAEALALSVTTSAQPAQARGSPQQVGGIDVWTDILPLRSYEVLAADVQLTYGPPPVTPSNVQQVQQPEPTRDMVLAAAAAKAREHHGDAALVTTRMEPVLQQVAQQGAGHSRAAYRVTIIRYTGAGATQSP